MAPEKKQEPDELELPKGEDALRRLAVQRLRKQAEFRTHLVVYLTTNVLLVAIWWATGAAFFWPVFPIFGWGIGLAAHAWDAFGPAGPNEPQIQAEMKRLRMP